MGIDGVGAEAGSGEPPEQPWVLAHSWAVGFTGAVVVIALAVTGMLAGRYGFFISDNRLDGVAFANARNGIRDSFLKLSAGAAAIVAGMLGWGRLQLSHQQGERDYQATRLTRRIQADVEAGRITERYTKAVEQLGSTDVAVRLGALYALEALAHDSERHRVTIADVICAYARHHSVRRNPDTGEPITAMETDGVEHPVNVDGRAVDYRAAIRIALRLPIEWSLPTLDLTGVVVTDLNVNDLRPESDDRRIGAVRFDRAKFHGETWFGDATFVGTSDFGDASFLGSEAWFGEATFIEEAWFNSATFSGRATFSEARFSSARFDGALFGDRERGTWSQPADFSEATFSYFSSFNQATFGGWALFEKSTFEGDVDFSKAWFCSDGKFDAATFHGTVAFVETSFEAEPTLRDARFMGGVAIDEEADGADMLLRLIDAERGGDHEGASG